MVDNTGNTFNAAPDKGSQNGPVWKFSGSFENYMAKLRANQTANGNLTARGLGKRDPAHWLKELGPKGIVSSFFAVSFPRRRLIVWFSNPSSRETTSSGVTSQITALWVTVYTTTRRRSMLLSRTETAAAWNVETRLLRALSSTFR